MADAQARARRPGWPRLPQARAGASGSTSPRRYQSHLLRHPETTAAEDLSRLARSASSGSKRAPPARTVNAERPSRDRSPEVKPASRRSALIATRPEPAHPSVSGIGREGADGDVGCPSRRRRSACGSAARATRSVVDLAMVQACPIAQHEPHLGSQTPSSPPSAERPLQDLPRTALPWARRRWWGRRQPVIEPGPRRWPRSGTPGPRSPCPGPCRRRSADLRRQRRGSRG